MLQENVEDHTPMLDWENELMILAAFRYSLNRSSYIVSICQDWLSEQWFKLSYHTQLNVLRDIVQAIMESRCDNTWISWAENHITPQLQKRVQEALDYTHKPWPWTYVQS
jgi:hypothetical protein